MPASLEASYGDGLYEAGTYAGSATSTPTVSTQAASSVSSSTVTLNGNVTDNNGASSTIRGFVYATNAGLTESTATTSESGTYDTGSYTTDVTSLTCNTDYYFHAFATNASGTGYDLTLSFTTDACASSGGSGGGSSKDDLKIDELQVSDTSVTVSGEINDDDDCRSV